MAAEMPAQIAAAPGAAVICFPWTHATDVLAALNTVATTLTSHLEARPLMVATLADWKGTYRDDFDVVHERLTTAATALAESAASRASAVVTGAEEANNKQHVANQHALIDDLGIFDVSDADTTAGADDRERSPR